MKDCTEEKCEYYQKGAKGNCATYYDSSKCCPDIDPLTAKKDAGAKLACSDGLSCVDIKEKNMASRLATEIAAQIWCKKETEHIEMDVTLAEAFAEEIDKIWGKPWLGNATTGELIDELRARAEVDGTINYKTVQAT